VTFSLCEEGRGRKAAEMQSPYPAARWRVIQVELQSSPKLRPPARGVGGLHL